MSDNLENPKKKRHNLSVDQRYNIVQRLKAGERAQSLAKEYNISKQAISFIKKKGNTIIETREILKACNGNIDKKRYKKQEENILDQKLLKWFYQQRSMGRPVSGRILQKQALLYNKRLNCKEKFAASDGWLANFKKRYGLKTNNIHGKKLSADLESSEEFKDDEVSHNDQICMTDDTISDDNIPTFQDALSALNTFLRWYQRKGDSQDVLKACQKARRELVKHAIYE